MHCRAHQTSQKGLFYHLQDVRRYCWSSRRLRREHKWFCSRYTARDGFLYNRTQGSLALCRVREWWPKRALFRVHPSTPPVRVQLLSLAATDTPASFHSTPPPVCTCAVPRISAYFVSPIATLSSTSLLRL